MSSFLNPTLQIVTFLQITKLNKHVSSELSLSQSSVLVSLLYVSYTADLPTSDRSQAATFADDTIILAQKFCFTNSTKSFTK